MDLQSAMIYHEMPEVSGVSHLFKWIKTNG